MLQIPPEKQLILLWMRDTFVSLSSMSELLHIDIDIISRFFKNLKIFPSKLFYSEREIQSLLSFSVFTFITKSIPFQPSFVRNGTNYYNQEDVLDHIYKNQLKFDPKHANFLSNFYKYHRPWAQIKCFFCGVLTQDIQYYEGVYTPFCPACLEKQERLRWKYRDIYLAKVRYRKHGGKYGFRQSSKVLFTEFLINSRMLPFTTSKRINSLREICKFLYVERVKFTAKMNYRVLQEIKHGPGEDQRFVPRFKIGLESRYRNQKRKVQ